MIRNLLVRHSFLVASGCVIAMLLAIPVRPKPFGDGWFHEDAKALAAALRGEQSWGAVSIRHAPGPVPYYAAAYLLASWSGLGTSDDSLHRAAVVLNSAALLASLFLVTRGAMLLGGPHAGVIAGYLTALNPLGAYYAWGVLAETPAYFSAALSVYGLGLMKAGKWVLHPRALMPLVLGLVGLIACRPNAFLTVAFALILWSLPGRHIWRNVGAARKATVVIVGLTAGCLVAVFALVRCAPTRNQQQMATLTWVMLHGSFQFRNEPFDWRYWDDEFRGDSADYAEWKATNAALASEARRTGRVLEDLRLNWVLDDLLSRPLLRLRMAGVRMLYLQFWTSHAGRPEHFKLGPLRGRPAYYLSHVSVNLIQCVATGLFLVWCWVSRRELVHHWPLWLPWFSLLLFSSFIYAEPRYLYPGQAGVFAAAGMQLSRLLGDRMPAAHDGGGGRVA